ncbi:hypothetical protein ACBJ59_43450 [Nonomuraea sp. MTCD27]|uniref:hypothetical protein n=1 Tax=Nonomuraea sp. MTCD27 TaxID=1676747 RepID=UPI0035C065E7
MVEAVVLGDVVPGDVAAGDVAAGDVVPGDVVVGREVPASAGGRAITCTGTTATPSTDPR